MNLSVKIRLRKPAKADGTCAILMRAILGREIWPCLLKISWAEMLFDEERGVCLTSLPAEQRPDGYDQVLQSMIVLAGGTAEALAKRAADYNLLIGKALAKANEVQILWRLSGQVMTMARFRIDFETSGSREDFLEYYRTKLKERWRKGKIKDTTHKNHGSTLNMLRNFQSVIPFNSLTTDFADEFNLFLVKRGIGVNSRWSRHKDVKTYLALAKKDRLRFEDPYLDFKNKEEPGKWKPLKTEELEKLEQYYRLCARHSIPRRVLAKFLFSCCSSLRLGDLKNIAAAKLENQELTFKAQKTYSLTLRETLLPLTRRALGYLRDAQEEENLPGFYDYADQYSNKVLRQIGVLLGIETRIHWHVGRETFATEFIRRGGQVVVLQKLMGHTNITTTMKYVHVDDEMKRAAIAQMDQLDAAA